ncbi:hypothetical protein DRK08_24760, partial [Salmonella enterica subsp. enterica serovar Schwarzengrund]|nr:hypothetical protein [Salmonella enterica subsp. enterica serovar Schwarzengrund]
ELPPLDPPLFGSAKPIPNKKDWEPSVPHTTNPKGWKKGKIPWDFSLTPDGFIPSQRFLLIFLLVYRWF